MATCYRHQIGQDIVAIPGFTPCANFKSTTGVSTCCAQGHVCLEDGFCHNPSSAQGQSGYYMAICTDPTYTDALCTSRCSKLAGRLVTKLTIPVDLVKGDVVYNSNTNLWSCCGQTNNTDSNSAVSCNNPTSETFQDLSPQNLLTATTSASSTSSSASSTSISISSATSSSTASPSISSIPNNTSSGLSTGAKAGIGVGAALIIVFILSLILFFVTRSRRNKKRNSYQQHAPTPKVEMAGDYVKVPISSQTPMSELDNERSTINYDHGNTVRKGISSQYPVQELEGSNMR